MLSRSAPRASLKTLMAQSPLGLSTPYLLQSAISPLPTAVVAGVAIALLVSVLRGHLVAQFVGDGVVGGALGGRLAAAWVPGRGRPWCPR
jgi:hypothetical protein